MSALTKREDRPAAAGASVVVTAQLDTAKEFWRPTSTSWDPGLKPYLHSASDTLKYSPQPLNYQN